jgi:hypothetical protein
MKRKLGDLLACDEKRRIPRAAARLYLWSFQGVIEGGLGDLKGRLFRVAKEAPLRLV